jgi:hypothetical protein
LKTCVAKNSKEYPFFLAQVKLVPNFTLFYCQKNLINKKKNATNAPVALCGSHIYNINKTVLTS